MGKEVITNPAKTTGVTNQPAARGAPTGGTPGKPGAPMPVTRRGPGTKEVIPFCWKICGYGDGYTLTLFKSVERADADAQLARLLQQKHYQGLQVFGIDDKVPPPPNARKHKPSPLRGPASSKRNTTRGGMRETASAKSAKDSNAKSQRTQDSKKSARKATVARSAKTPTAKTTPTGKTKASKTAKASGKRSTTTKKKTAPKAGSPKKKTGKVIAKAGKKRQANAAGKTKSKAKTAAARRPATKTKTKSTSGTRPRKTGKKT